MSELAIIFDGSFEGFLCTIYAYYYDKVTPLYIQTDSSRQQALGVEEYYVATDYDKAVRVQSGIRNKISSQAEDYLVYAFLSCSSFSENNNHNCYLDMFHYVILGFKVGKSVDNHLQKDCVLSVHKQARAVAREAHLLSGFCRFAETKQKLFYCSISPIHNVLSILAEHFQDRMMNQAWIIHDKKRNKAAIYDGHQYVIEDVPKNIRDVKLDYDDKEELIQSLWGTFFDSVSIKERTNKSLQRNNLPLHFRKSMVEFNRI
ncbi:MAG: TIGR03915 family putative DNA repair protein [Defluviitaleaceae bacterium]|nr:TIGR03915 family putative DNA repair protein [Defluviitaleaceae bacterium]